MNTTVFCLFALAAAEEEAQPYLEEARGALAAGELAHAGAALDDALARDPQNIDALQGAALLAIERQRPEEAIARLEHLLKIDPNNDWARLALARAQWLIGATAEAAVTTRAVLDRHPTLIEALQLNADLRDGARAATASRWRPRARVGVAGVYDSNLSLDPGLVPDATNRDALLLNLDAALLLDYDGLALPLTALARLDSFVPLDEGTELGRLAPTTLTAGLIAQLPLGRLAAALDLRYEELFTELFATHLQRSIHPSLYASYPLGTVQRLRLLAGAEVRLPEESFAPGSNTTFKASLRDTIRLERLLLLIDLGGRLNNGSEGASTDIALRTNFAELSGGLLAEYTLLADLAIFALASTQARKFEQGLKESTYAGLAGLRWTLDNLELHAGYGYTQNLSDRQRSFSRHQLTAGVRASYP